MEGEIEIQGMFADAVAHHQAGRLGEAERLYRQVLAVDPGHADSLHLLGVLANQVGRPDLAAELIGRAIAADGSVAAYHSNLGVALNALGQVDAVAACYQRAIALAPGYAEAHYNLGNALMQQGRPDEAAACYRRAVALQPDYAQAHDNLGVALRELGRADEAEACHRRAVALRPDLAAAHINLGKALLDRGRLDEAVESYRRAAALRPDLAEAHSNLGRALLDQGHLDEAAACHRRAIALQPDLVEAHSDLGYALLVAGNYQDGWPEREWRERAKGAPRPFPQPRWTGQDLRGRRLLVWGEQGVGDELVYFGLCAELLERGAAVVAECDPRLVDLLARSLPGIEVVARRDPSDPRCLEADLQVPLEGAAALLRPSLDGFRPLRPYLVADAADTAGLRARYGGGGEMLVGIAWWTVNRKRTAQATIPLRQWLPVLAVPGVRFVSLQYGDHAAEIADVRGAGVSIVVDDGVDQFNDLDRLAAQVSAMDLVVAIDNSTALLASVLGRPVWCLVDTAPFWRMGLAGESSPWHPGLRLFRQRQRGEWADVLARVAGELRRLAMAEGRR